MTDVSFGPYRLKRQEWLVEGPDGPVDLSARAFDLLCVLLDHAGEVVSEDAIFAAVWPGMVVEENTLQVHVSTLRKALAKGGLSDADAADMLFGISLSRDGKTAEANKAFAAIKDPKFAEVAKLWILKGR